MKNLWCVTAILVVASSDAAAQNRLALEPSIEVRHVDDSNLYFDGEEGASDRILRITPGFSLRFDSPRWTASGTYQLDSERYDTYSALDNDRARERAVFSLQYEASPRVTLMLNTAHVTDTLAELNLETGIGASRARARQLSISPSATIRLSPRLIATTSASATNTDVENGIAMRSQVQTLGLQRSVSRLDSFRLDYQHSNIDFEDVAATSVETHTLLATWSRAIGAHTQLTFQAGPRYTDGAPATADMSAAVTRNWSSSSANLAFARNQTTVIGHVGIVDTETVHARFTLFPNRKFSAYAAPALIRSTQSELNATVYRIGLGARYAFTPAIGFDVLYNHDRQNGSFDPLRSNDELSRATLSFGFTARWNSAGAQTRHQ